MKKKESKTVVLPLADGRKIRIEREKIMFIGLQYEAFSSHPSVMAFTMGAQYRLALSIDEARRLVWGGIL